MTAFGRPAPRVRVRLRRARTGDPFPCFTAAMYGVDRIVSASKEGVGVYLSAEETRALHWCINNVQEEPDGSDWRNETPRPYDILTGAERT